MKDFHIFIKIFCFLSSLMSTLGDGEVTFLQLPPSVSFEGNETLPLSLISDIYSSVLGFSLQKGHDWKGIRITDPFNFAKSIIVVLVPGLHSVSNYQGFKLKLVSDSTLEDVWSSLDSQLNEHFPNRSKELQIYIDLDDIKLGNSTMASLKINICKHLNPEVEDNKRYLDQISVLNSISRNTDEKMEKRIKTNRIPNIHWIVVTGMYPLILKRGLESDLVLEAITLLDNSLQNLIRTLTNAYDKRVLVSLLVTDEMQPRRFRRSIWKDGLIQKKSTSKFCNIDELKPAESYSEDYPVIFNLLLWFTIMYAFILLAVAISIANMDPGRDSIIFRVTTSRMKKED